jgi:hypothetical protein
MCNLPSREESEEEMNCQSKRKQAEQIVNRASFTIRALRLIERLDAHCRDQGLQAYLHEWETWNPEYASDVKLLMGEAFEIMRLNNFLREHDLRGCITGEKEKK